uniref:Uncharacterized protein n=1 Tax=Arundo donax TaxID=35708 RepID=A0A0A9BAM2_ARUDO
MYACLLKHVSLRDMLSILNIVS